ncbi:MAG: hypothetical protein FJ399_12510 [Verrucomicrobia bacterium]|nr:hypothetical protein [Verrucomicrobiota bacterium]
MSSILSRREFFRSSGIAFTAASLASFARASEAEPSGLLFFDAFTEIGPRPNKPASQQWRLDELRAEMEHCSIAGALVSGTMAIGYDAMWSNLELSRMLAALPGGFAVWNIMPDASGEFPAPPQLGRLMREHGVRAVALHPVSNAWSLKADSSAPLLRWLAEERVLTHVPRAQLGGYDDLAALLKAYPDLPVLLTGATWTDQRIVIPLLTAHRNLHLTFDHFQIFNGLEDLVAAGCEDQLLFGSNSPTMSAGAHRAYVDYADIPSPAKRKIAGGNLTRLLHGQGPAAPRHNPNEDSLMRAIRLGRPLPAPVVDLHLHILDDGLNGAGGRYRMSHGDAAGSFALGKRLGYVGGAVMSWNGTVGVDAVGGNATIRRVLDRAPPGYWGAATFDPSHYSQSELAGQIARCYEDQRFVGMKPYTRFGLEYTHRGYDLWWDFGQRHRLYALIHRTRSDFREVETLAARFPGVRWVVTHMGMSWDAATQAVEVMKRFPNVYAEITYTNVPLGMIDFLVANGGEDRVLYGSDLPMRDPRQQLGWVVFSRLPIAAKMKVLGRNALRVLGPCLDRLPAANRPAVAAKHS